MTTLGTGTLGSGTLADPGGEWEVVASGVGTLSYADTAAQPSTTYTYRVRGENSAGPGPWSSTATATTPAAPTAEALSLSAETADQVFARGHVVVTRVDVWQNGETIVRGLPVIAGRVDEDATAKHRRRVQLTIVDEDYTLLPLRSSDALSPYGHELAVYRGAVVDGRDKLWPLGVFRIDQSSWRYDVSGTVITVEGYDRSIALSDYKTEAHLSFKLGRNYGDVIHRFTDWRFPGIRSHFVSVSERVRELLVYEAGVDPWEEALSVATSLGLELFFDVLGTLVLRPIPEASVLSTPVATYKDGEGGTLVGMGSTMSAAPGYNRVIVTSAGLRDKPVRWMSDDKNPQSPTYVFGPYGVRTLIVRDEKVGSIEQARAAARGILARSLGGTETATIQSWVDPRRKAGDVIEIKADRHGYTRTAVAERVSTPLEYDGIMEIQTRAQHTILEEG